jgi:hypothetical protein
MSYGFSLLFVREKFRSEGEAMVYARELAKRLSCDFRLSKEHIALFPLTISSRLHRGPGSEEHGQKPPSGQVHLRRIVG